MTADEFEIEKQIMQMKQDGEIKDENEIRNKLKKLQTLQKERQLADETAAAFERLAQTLNTEIAAGIKGLIKGTSTLGDLVRNVADKLLDVGLNLLLYGNPMANAVTGGFFKLLGFANGGKPPVGKPSVVGEKGPELFVPDSSGTIIPNNQLGGSTNIVVNVDASGSSVEGDEQQGKELGRLISVAIQSELIQQKRPGGLLA